MQPLLSSCLSAVLPWQDEHSYKYLTPHHLESRLHIPEGYKAKPPYGSSNVITYTLSSDGAG